MSTDALQVTNSELFLIIIQVTSKNGRMTLYIFAIIYNLDAAWWSVYALNHMCLRILSYLFVTSFHISTEHVHLCFPSKVLLGKNLKWRNYAPDSQPTLWLLVRSVSVETHFKTPIVSSVGWAEKCSNHPFGKMLKY